jgi:hypothetical protein
MSEESVFAALNSIIALCISEPIGATRNSVSASETSSETRASG